MSTEKSISSDSSTLSNSTEHLFCEEENVVSDIPKNRKRKNSDISTEEDRKPLGISSESRFVAPVKCTEEKKTNRPVLYSENSYGLHARGHHTNHLTVECLVSVPAQLFIWDDALGGFLPTSFCNVSLLQQITCQQTLSPTLVQPVGRNSWSADHSTNNNMLAAPAVAKVTPVWEYSIQCQRKSDSKTIIECTLAAHMTYICALPTFHHWRIGDRKFALSFASDYSASKFHNRLQKALSHLSRQSKSTIAGSGESNLDATDDLEDDVFVTTDSSETPSAIPRPWPKRSLVSTNYSSALCPSLSVTNHLDEEVDCFEDENTDKYPLLCSMLPSAHFEDRPPVDPDSARPSGTMLTLASVSPCVNCHKCYGSPAFISSISSDNEPSSAGSDLKKMSLSPKTSDSGKPRLIQSSSSGGSSIQEKTSTSSLKFGKMRSIRSSSNPGSIMLVQKLSNKGRETEIAKSKSLLEAHLRNTYTNNAMRNASFELVQRERCKYCSQWYNVKDNKKGDCLDAPDTVETWIKRVTLYSWANDFVNRRVQSRNGNVSKRKIWFSLLGCVFPCLCCYLPLMKTYQSDKFQRISSCCGVCRQSTLKEVNQEEVPTRRNRKRRKLAKHVPVSQGTTKSAGSRRKFDQLHQQGSRTSSSQQMFTDSYMNFKAPGNYGGLVSGSGDAGGTGIIQEKFSAESSKTDQSVSMKMTRPLNSRLSF
ncbi:hypothetical protein FO519_009193 [Halicephalobus sp. NKZ332]|nr:hypothetical protein FO519_009193 [Halicephalobus sp. NKZ332]